MSKFELIFKEIPKWMSSVTGQKAQLGTCRSPDGAVSSEKYCRIGYSPPRDNRSRLFETLPEGGACMALSRSTVLLLLLPCPAVVFLSASLEDVSATSQCLPSPEAVRQAYPGAWASWTLQAPNHKGVKCWF